MAPKTLLYNTKIQLLSVIAASLFFVAIACSTSIVKAAGETITTASSASTEMKTASPVAGIQINGSDNSTVPVKLLVTNGSLSMSTTTGLTFTGPSSGSTLYFSGTRSNVNAALATLTYTRNTAGTDTLEVSLVGSGEVFFGGNGHLYEYVSDTLTWGGAKTAAEGRTKYGATGYLATITSQAENDFVSARLANAGWMGASDSASEGTWKWVTGPEAGTQFCSGNNPCNSFNGRYTNWNNGEPNDSSGNEDCGQFLSGGSGKWNDLPCSGTTLPGYVVEYGAAGNMPSVAAANIAITTADTTAPTTPGTPTAASPTTDNTPLISWSSSTDGGTGLKNPAYTVEWSNSPTFASVTGSTTTNSTNLSPSAGLADGSWYFRVKATDNASNVATSSISSVVIIDTTAPTTPGTPTVGTAWTNDNTPTWTWTASADSGVGLATIAYSIEWSQSASFAGLGGTAGIPDATTYTIPDGLNMSDGTWYFRVKAIDALGHESPWSSYGTARIDTAAPVITRNGPSSVTTVQGVTYTDAGASANDGAEGDISEAIVSHSNVNAAAPGTYIVTYNVADSAGNAAVEVTRTVHVVSNVDLNDDGTADAVQQNVVGTVNEATDKHVVVQVDAACTLSDVSAMNQADITRDNRYEYPVGLLDFTADCGTGGYTTTVTHYYYDAPQGDFSLRKYMNGSFQTIASASISRQVIDGVPVLVASYPVTDGGELDADGMVNGVIVDPAGPALLNRLPAASGGLDAAGTRGMPSVPDTGVTPLRIAVTDSVLLSAITVAMIGALLVTPYVRNRCAR